MYRHLCQFLGVATKVYDHFRGERTLRIVAVNSSPHESYRVDTTNGGTVVIYCTETVYEVCFTAWWVRNRRFYSYMVYGVCDAKIPKEFADRIQSGFNIGRLLPRFAFRADQKKAAIHAYMSLIVNELGQKTN